MDTESIKQKAKTWVKDHQAEIVLSTAALTLQGLALSFAYYVGKSNGSLEIRLYAKADAGQPLVPVSKPVFIDR